jgi:hypothetical protein
MPALSTWHLFATQSRCAAAAAFHTPDSTGLAPSHPRNRRARSDAALARSLLAPPQAAAVLASLDDLLAEEPFEPSLLRAAAAAAERGSELASLSGGASTLSTRSVGE